MMAMYAIGVISLVIGKGIVRESPREITNHGHHEAVAVPVDVAMVDVAMVDEGVIHVVEAIGAVTEVEANEEVARVDVNAVENRISIPSHVTDAEK